MIIMNLKLNNLFAFRNFKANFSRSIETENTTINGEYLKTKPNFKYKKLNIIMGTNASGKTSLGKALRDIFNFMTHYNVLAFQDDFLDESKPAYFSLDFLVDEDYLYRINCLFSVNRMESLNIYKSKILEDDSYETCAKKFVELYKDEANYTIKLSALPENKWVFVFPQDEYCEYKIDNYKTHLDLEILSNVLKTLDPSIVKITHSKEIPDGYVIRSKNGNTIIQKGKFCKNILSSGTKSGLEISNLIFAIHKNPNGFYYCDEQFPFIQSDIEKAILSLMISLLNNNSQLFFTTHNLNILDMNLPIHSFMFLKKDETIEVVYPEKKLKDSDEIKEAINNDVFNISPSLENIFLIEEICRKSPDNETQ
ncbi:MAG: AAA family ATPase [Treponema sp.]